MFGNKILKSILSEGIPFVYVYISEVKDNIGQNTTSLLAGCRYGVNDATCFCPPGGNHQVYKCYS